MILFVDLVIGMVCCVVIAVGLDHLAGGNSLVNSLTKGGAIDPHEQGVRDRRAIADRYIASLKEKQNQAGRAVDRVSPQSHLMPKGGPSGDLSGDL